MKTLLKIGIFFTICFSGLILFTLSAQETKIDKSWDLMRDIRDFQSGRLHFYLYPGTYIESGEDNGPITIIYNQPNPYFAPAPFFNFSFPHFLARKNFSIDLDFEWPSSKGYLLMLFTAWFDEKKKDKVTAYTGVLIEFVTDSPGLYAGNLLSVFNDEKDSNDYDYTSLPFMGGEKHRLKVNVGQQIITANLDGNKSVSWSGRSSPIGFYLSGVYMYPTTNGGPSFIIHKLKLKVNLSAK